jgi:hypothetical protein
MDRELRKAIHRIAAHNPKLSKNIISSILDIIKTEVTVKDSVFDSNDDMVINCRGGELYLIDGNWSLKPARLPPKNTRRPPASMRCFS